MQGDPSKTTDKTGGKSLWAIIGYFIIITSLLSGLETGQTLVILRVVWWGWWWKLRKSL
jgi:hypothetical protein